MIQIVVCGDIELEDGEFSAELERCVQTHAEEEMDLHVYDSPLEAVEYTLDTTNEEPVDLVFCNVVMTGLSGIEMARELHDAGSGARVVLFADDDQHAYDALVLHAGGYLVAPAFREAFERVTGRLVEEVAAAHGGSVVLPCRDGVRRIGFSDLVFTETSNHDQVLHLKDKTTTSLRISSQALFEKLSHHPRFFKLGSSYIVNLDFVRTVRSSGGVVCMYGDQELSVPVRLRKTLGNALMESE